MKKYLVAALAICIAGCGTLFIPSNVNVPVESTPDGATVHVDGIAVGQTPMSIMLDNSENHVILLSQEGYQQMTCVLTAKIHTGVLVLDLFGAVPLIIDAATGNWRRLDKKNCTVALPKQ